MSDIRFILYISPFEKSCITALKYAAAINIHIAEIDVKRMKNQKPVWLTGVPTLVDREKTLIYRGTNCLKKLQSLCVHAPVRTGNKTR
mgnify:CR=1 FL=1